MNIREQRINEKIAKLKELGIYEQWEKNLKDQSGKGMFEVNRDYLLGALKKTSDVISCAFVFRGTPEGYDFWKDVVIRLMNLGD